MATTTTIYADTDANLRENAADTNYSGNSVFRIGQYTGYRRHAVLHFDVSGYVPSKIVSAKLYLSASGDTGPTRTMKIARLNQDYVEAEVTWNSASSGVAWTGGAGGDGNGAFTEPTYSISVGDGEGDQEVDIRELVIDAINRRDDELWLIICFDPADTATETGRTYFYPSEYGTASYRPKIAVTVAARRTWTGSVSGDMSDGNNWNGAAGVPTSDDVAMFNTGTNDATLGALDCWRLHIGKSYRGSIGQMVSLLRVDAESIVIDNKYAGVNITINLSPATNADLRIVNTSRDNVHIDGYYHAIITGTGHAIDLKTDSGTTIEAHGSGSNFTTDTYFASCKLSNGVGTLNNGAAAVHVMRGRVTLDGTESQNVTLANGTIKVKANDIGVVRIYAGKLSYATNESGENTIGELYVYNNGLADTRTGGATLSTITGSETYGGRILFDGAMSVDVS